MRGAIWRNVSCILVTVLMICAWVTTGIPSTKRPFAFFSFVKVWKISAALLAASLLLFISSPLSVLAATQELTRLGRLRLYPLKGKFLMCLQKPPPSLYLLSTFPLPSPYFSPFFLSMSASCFFSLFTLQSGCRRHFARDRPSRCPSFFFLPSIHPTLPTPPFFCSPTSSRPLSLYMFQARSQTWAQAADGVYNKPPSWFHMPWN